MTLVDLALAKRHLRVSWDDEDTEISAYLDAAETIIIEYLDRTVQAEEPLPADDEYAILVSPPIVAAILLMTGDLYDRRDTAEQSDAKEAVLPAVVRRLLAPYRVWRTYEEETEDAVG